MKFKQTMKHNREPSRVACESKGSPMISNIQVITENVLVPITKTIFTKCHREKDCSKRKVKLVKPCRSNDNVIGPLLKRPSNVPEETYTSTLLRIEQSDSRWNSLKKKPKKPFHVTDKSSPRRMNEYFQNQKREERTELPFPSPIFALPMTALSATRTALSFNGSFNESSKSMERNERHNKASQRTSKAMNNVRRRFETKSSELLAVPENSAWNLQIPSNTSNDIATRYSLISYYDSVLMELGLIDQVKGTLSSSMDGIKKSSQCSSMSFVETKNHQTTEFQLSSHTPLTKDTVDRSTFTYFLEDPSKRCYQETNSPPNEHSCKIKYSWQVIGKGSQTSRTLLESIIKGNDFDDESVHQCSIKYSWQIIGIATQTSKRDFEVAEGRSAVSFPFTKVKRTSGNIMSTNNSAQAVTVWRNGKRFILLNNQCTQTAAHKANQTSYLEIHKKCY